MLRLRRGGSRGGAAVPAELCRAAYLGEAGRDFDAAVELVLDAMRTRRAAAVERLARKHSETEVEAA